MNVVAIISGAISLVEQLIPYIAKLRSAARQSRELTPQQDAEFDARLTALFDQPHWKPEVK